MLLSCNSKKENNSSVDSDGKLLAELFCNARVLRDQRFHLADLIRFTEDSLGLYKDARSNYYKMRLDSLNSLVADIHLKTKSMADSIRNTQQMLYNQTYRSKEEKNSLDQAFQKAILTLCPE